MSIEKHLAESTPDQKTRYLAAEGLAHILGYVASRFPSVMHLKSEGLYYLAWFLIGIPALAAAFTPLLLIIGTVSLNLPMIGMALGTIAGFAVGHVTRHTKDS